MNLGLDLERPFVVIDLETTSDDVNTARIVQIAYQRYFRDPGDSSLTVRKYVQYVNPTVKIIPEAIEAHGITDEMVRGKPTFEDLSEKLYEDLQDVDFGGYNVSFDLQILVAEFGRLRQFLDTTQADIVDGYKLWIKLRPRTLSDAVREFLGTEPENAHDALADVEMTAGVLEQQRREAVSKRLINPEKPNMIRQLSELSFPNRVDLAGKFVRDENGDIRFTFGAHVGMLARERINYLQWMRNQDFPIETKLWCRKIIKGVKENLAF